MSAFPRIGSVLVANRGEIAVRIMRTAKARGVKTVAVYSDADTRAFHVRQADEAFRIGPAEPSQSYLNIDAIIDAAKRAGADAIHPGYGFLAERAAFAQACEEAGLIFIGPPASAIAAMGDKAESKRRMIAAGVPCIPGYQDEDQSDDRLIAEAKRIGFPLMLKASAGGGGRGQRIVHKADELAEEIVSARRESGNAFGDTRLIIERAIVGARLVEAQVMADAHGNIIHLGERDCSLQRRRQKVIEEAPSPVISLETRATMGAAAVEAARAVGYRSAGTVEFLFDPARREFFFLEMNTRIQVEHPVTEEVTGLDLVAMQFDIAEGKKLPLTQEGVRLDGWAMEARLYAEDPAKGFLPQTGRLASVRFTDSVRVDTGVETGDEVASFYDPMIAKIIAHGATRDEARLKLAAALEQTTILGVMTNAPFLVSLLRDETFARGEADTNYIEANLHRLAASAPVSAREIALAAAALTDAPFGALLTGWSSRGGARFPLKLAHDDTVLQAKASIEGASIDASFGEESAAIAILEKTATSIRFREGDAIRTAAYSRDGAGAVIQLGPVARPFIDMTFAPANDAGAGADTVKAPMAGIVTGVGVEKGARVAKGQTVATIEAMKMEHRLAAPRDGVVAEVRARQGEQVAIRAVIVVLEEARP
ncbi:MAG: biotin carboxylase N-terminal domain-containing protein [Amphiplicatus sp.]